MEKLFTTLTHAVEGAPLIAVCAAFLWGILSIVLSPCHLASIPLIVAFVNDQGPSSPRRAFTVSGLFALGILSTIGIIGVATAAAGTMPYSWAESPGPTRGQPSGTLTTTTLRRTNSASPRPGSLASGWQRPLFPESSIRLVKGSLYGLSWPAASGILIPSRRPGYRILCWCRDKHDKHS